MRPETLWEKIRKHIVWGQWSVFTPPKLRRFGSERTFVVGKLKLIWKVRS